MSLWDECAAGCCVCVCVCVCVCSCVTLMHLESFSGVDMLTHLLDELSGSSERK